MRPLRVLSERCKRGPRRLRIEGLQAVDDPLQRSRPKRSLERPGKVAGEEARALRRVAAAGELCQSAVLGERAAVAAGSARREQDPEAQRAGAEGADQPHERVGATAGDERDVEVGVRRLQVEEALDPPRLCRPQLSPSLRDLATPGGLSPLEREAERVRLEQQSQLVDLDQLGDGEVGDTSSPLGAQHHEALGGKRPERLAQRRGAHLPTLSQRLHADPLARRKLSGDDGVSQAALRPLAAAPGSVGERRSRRACVARRKSVIYRLVVHENQLSPF